MSASGVTNRLVRLETMCSSGGEESHAERELNGSEEGEDARTDEEGEGVGGEGETRTADWRVRTGPRNKPTAGKNTKQHTCRSATGAHNCTMGRGRTHHHVSKKKSAIRAKSSLVEETNSIHGLHCFFKPNSTANFQTIPDESVTCIAVKEDRLQIIMSRVFFEGGNRRTLGKRESGKIHQLVGVQRDHVENRHRARNNRLQKSCSREMQ